MNERTRRLRQASYQAEVTLSSERAALITEFHRENLGRWSPPMMRAKALEYVLHRQSLYIGDGELIVGERGPRPKATPTYPEVTCHSEEDLRILDRREKTPYRVSEEDMEVFRKEVIPFWRGRTLRERIFQGVSEEWKAAYEAGVFTEFMEQRAPGHTTLDGKFYAKGLEDFKTQITERIDRLDFLHDPRAAARREELRAMLVACDAVIAFAERHADRAEEMAATEEDAVRRDELERIAAVCRRVPRHAPRNLWEALQMYWFMHLGTIIELNGWDSMNPGHLDRHLAPFYRADLEKGVLTRESARELIECFWIKFNNHPAPPKVGVTAQESGTYNDFTNINLGGVLPDGRDGVNELSYLLLEVMDDLHLLQPQGNIQLSRKNDDRFLKAALGVVRKGYGYPSVFNADGVVEQLVRAGKSLQDAREGGTSGCIETGAFGKEAYILTGYLNLPKILEIALNDGIDPRTGRQIGPATGDPREWESLDDAMAAFTRQLRHFVDVKIEGNQFIERLYAENMPAPFLSVLIDDCIEKGRDYNDGGPRYNTSYIQCVGIGTITDSLSAIETHVFEKGEPSMDALLDALATDFAETETLRLHLANHTPRYGNDDEQADGIMMRVFDTLVKTIDGRPNTKGGRYHVDMLPTTSHIYFGSVTGATADGRHKGAPLSEGISPVQGADRQGPTAVIRSAARMDHLHTGGTLLNLKFMPSVLEDDEGLGKLAQLVRTYFRLDGHHVQFNVVGAETLREAQKHPEEHRDLIVRVAGYSDYFCDIGRELQDEIIRRTEHEI